MPFLIRKCGAKCQSLKTGLESWWVNDYSYLIRAQYIFIFIGRNGYGYKK